MTERVRQQFATEGVEATPAAVVDAVRREPGSAVLGDETVLRLAERVHDDLVGAGPLAPLLADPQVTDVLVNGVQVWVDRGTGLRRAEVRFESADEVRRLAQRLAAACGRRLDDGQPYADARLADGTRLHAVLPPVATDGPYVSLRTFRQRPFTLDDLVSHGTVAPEIAPVLEAIVRARLAYLITGGTGSGKTTLLGTMLGLIPPGERIVVVEDAAELRPEHPHVVALQTRTANVEGAGAVSLTDLVRQALRMRPDRLVIGECRGAEIVDLLGALNTGHEGGAGTLHANTPADVPARLEALGLLGGLPRAALHAQVVAALQVIIQVRRTEGGRSLESVSVLLPTGPDRVATVVPAWHRTTGPDRGAEPLAAMLSARGIPTPPVLTTHPTPKPTLAAPPPLQPPATQPGSPQPLPATREPSAPPPSALRSSSGQQLPSCERLGSAQQPGFSQRLSSPIKTNLARRSAAAQPSPVARRSASALRAVSAQSSAVGRSPAAQRSPSGLPSSSSSPALRPNSPVPPRPAPPPPRGRPWADLVEPESEPGQGRRVIGRLATSWSDRPHRPGAAAAVLPRSSEGAPASGSARSRS